MFILKGTSRLQVRREKDGLVESRWTATWRPSSLGLGLVGHMIAHDMVLGSVQRQGCWEYETQLMMARAGVVFLLKAINYTYQKPQLLLLSSWVRGLRKHILDAYTYYTSLPKQTLLDQRHPQPDQAGFLQWLFWYPFEHRYKFNHNVVYVLTSQNFGLQRTAHRSRTRLLFYLRHAPTWNGLGDVPP